MQALAKQFLTNLESIELYTGNKRKRWMIDLALQLTIYKQAFSGTQFEQVRELIKSQSKWYSTLRNSEKIHRSYYVHYGADQQAISQAIERQKLWKKTSILQVEDSFLAVVRVKDVARLENMLAALKKQPSLRYQQPNLLQVAALAKHTGDVEQIADAYEQYYQAFQQVKWKLSAEMRASAYLLASQTGHFDKAIWQRVVSLTESMRQQVKKIETKHYIMISLLALTNLKAADFKMIEQLHLYLKEQLRLSRYDDKSLLYAAQLYTLVEAPHIELVDTMDFVDLLVDFADISDGGSSDGGSGGGGD